eukprot:14852913-Heterocapsa_arctica.AAC.1
MEPSASELDELVTVGAVMGWLVIGDGLATVIHGVLGTSAASHPRTIAGIPATAYDTAFATARITTVDGLAMRDLTLAEQSHVGILRETCCLAAGTKMSAAALGAEALRVEA